MIIKFLSASILAIVSHNAFAQASCESLKTAVDAQIKKAASSYVEGITDNSAPRATMRQLEIANSLQLVQINLGLMAQNKCPARTVPVDPMIYLGEALDCELAMRKGEKDAPACKTANWKGMGSGSTPSNGGEG